VTQGFKVWPANRVIRLDNISCPYCGSLFSEKRTTVEHVIGRRFVPKATLNESWNLILRACSECNARKANLEDDISAITMAADISGRYAEEEAILRTEAERKGVKSLSRRTGKPVLASQE
jgi:5-methylcytosine-specific restriction endonuclease McrA